MSATEGNSKSVKEKIYSLELQALKVDAGISLVVEFSHSRPVRPSFSHRSTSIPLSRHPRALIFTHARCFTCLRTCMITSIRTNVARANKLSRTQPLVMFLVSHSFPPKKKPHSIISSCCLPVTLRKDKSSGAVSNQGVNSPPVQEDVKTHLAVYHLNMSLRERESSCQDPHLPQA